MSIQVTYSSQAGRQIRELSDWWRSNRRAAPKLFDTELARIIELLQSAPELGQPYSCRGIPGVRRCRVKGTPYRVYYLYEKGNQKLTIMAVWSSMRRRGPPLRVF